MREMMLAGVVLKLKQNPVLEYGMLPPYGLVGYFVIGFEVPSYPVYFSTSPHDTPTHWRQRIFFLNEPIQVQTGPLLCSSSISCFKNKDS
uniref:Protein arginine N-methyltransferase domain-containing protein n=1 Tax=Amphimedon queenslandica TaxID=400682 RepID=A0A1X7TGY4_AMPQE